jgi:NAD(P)H-hydrate epimerase
MKIISVDLPTGVYPDTGMVDPSAIKADITATLGNPKIGSLSFPGRTHIGDLKILDIGLIKHTSLEDKINLSLLTSAYVSNNLPIRHHESHKGTFGHVLLIAGSKNYVGAAVLAASGVVRSGAGLVTLATPESVYPIAASYIPEAIHLPLKEDADGRIHPDALIDISERITRYNVLAVGPGLGQSNGTKQFIASLLNVVSKTEIPIVIDADGLNNLSTIPEWWKLLKSPTVITPHPGELSGLTGKSTLTIQSDRINISREYSKLWNVTLVLKGALTVISSPSNLTSISPFINPGLATAGTGDVLTGIISGLIAQGSQVFPAACSGVYLHGHAGNLTTNALGISGIIASDIVNSIPSAIMSLTGINNPNPTLYNEY